MEGAATVVVRKLDVKAAPVECCTPVVSPVMTGEQAAGLATVFKSLADPSRVRILNLLATSEQPVCVCDVTASVRLSQATVSFHLKKLMDAGLIEREQRGRWAYYWVRREALGRLAGVFSDEGAMQ
jgi:ArsR family transcriptional regulator